MTVLTRNARKARKALPRDVRVAQWNPTKAGPWQEEVGVVDAVVHLAGTSVAARWTPQYKKMMAASRVESSRLLAEAMGSVENKPAVFVSASGVGFYGNSRSGECDEDSEPGSGFLAELCQNWEAAAREAEQHGVRSVQLRIGVVLGDGGALSRMIAPMRLFVSGPIGKGDNIMSWVHLDDVIGMILWSIENEEVSGAVNCTSPYHTTGRELAKQAGSVIGRPSVRTPEAAVRALMGEVTDTIVGSLDVYPRRAVALGYEYHHARLVPALEAALMPDGG